MQALWPKIKINRTNQTRQIVLILRGKMEPSQAKVLWRLFLFWNKERIPMRQTPCAQRYLEAVFALSPPMARRLAGLPAGLQDTVQEVRLRVNSPLAVFDGRHHFHDGAGKPVEAKEGLPSHEGRLLSAFAACAVFDSTPHRNQQGMSRCGRAPRGCCATASTRTWPKWPMRDVSTINLRVAREILASRTDLILRPSKGNYTHAARGRPSSGKNPAARNGALLCRRAAHE
jgi:stage III sporulation protein SpoIIIAA